MDSSRSTRDRARTTHVHLVVSRRAAAGDRVSLHPRSSGSVYARRPLRRRAAWPAVIVAVVVMVAVISSIGVHALLARLW